MVNILNRLPSDSGESMYHILNIEVTEMQLLKKRGIFDSQRIAFIPVDDIRPNPMQPRRVFDHDSLKELAESITQYGVIQPLNVRRKGKIYELVAGERRLRAARMAGLST